MSVIRKIINTILSCIIVSIMVISGGWAIYSLWDNSQVYSATRNTLSDLQDIKPDVENGITFEEILKINSDVCAWITMDGTEIDYPVVHGETNTEYLNKDVYGDFALSGSIFLDYRNNPDFSDTFNLIYGHHMDSDLMFGDLDYYKEQSFLDENTTGTLMLPDKSFNITVVSCLTVESSDDMIFKMELGERTVSEVVNYIKNNAVTINKTAINSITENEDVKWLVLATCSSEYNNARTVLICIME